MLKTENVHTSVNPTVVRCKTISPKRAPFVFWQCLTACKAMQSWSVVVYGQRRGTNNNHTPPDASPLLLIRLVVVRSLFLLPRLLTKNKPVSMASIVAFTSVFHCFNSLFFFVVLCWMFLSVIIVHASLPKDTNKACRTGKWWWVWVPLSMRAASFLCDKNI